MRQESNPVARAPSSLHHRERPAFNTPKTTKPRDRTNNLWAFAYEGRDIQAPKKTNPEAEPTSGSSIIGSGGWMHSCHPGTRPFGPPPLSLLRPNLLQANLLTQTSQLNHSPRTAFATTGSRRSFKSLLQPQPNCVKPRAKSASQKDL